MKHVTRWFTFAVVMGPLALTAVHARAGIIEVTDRTALGSNDLINWGTLGPDGTHLPNSFTATSNGGLKATVSQPSGGFEILNNGTDWSGNFAPGDHVLHGGIGPTLTIDYGTTGLLGAGAQIEADFGGAFVARITALDSGNNTLGTFTEAGFASSTGTAIFLGVLSDSANISKIVYSLDSASLDPNDFAINQVSLSRQASVPEPSVIVLAVLGMLVSMGGAFVRSTRSSRPLRCRRGH